MGIHPHDAGEATDADFGAMEDLAGRSTKVVALGEMGLDYFRNLSPPDVQAQVFRRQLGLARRLGKPVVVHCRDAHPEALAILAEERVADVGGVMHCFSGDVAVAKRCLDLGLLISLAGPVTYKNARALPEVARYVPEDRLVVETDCPYLPPHPHRGQRNEPAYVALTAARVAELRGADLESIAAAMSDNAARLFRISIDDDPGKAPIPGGPAAEAGDGDGRAPNRPDHVPDELPPDPVRHARRRGGRAPPRRPG